MKINYFYLTIALLSTIFMVFLSTLINQWAFFPFLMMFLGALFNSIAVFGNNGFMPVSVPKLFIPLVKEMKKSRRHIFYEDRKKARFYYLTDMFNFIINRKKCVQIHAFSIGDVCYFIGLFWFISNIFRFN